MARKHLAPRLIPIDMLKSDESNHPDLNATDTYLCLIGNDYYVGKFRKEWFGWSFDGWTPNLIGLQFDAPGTNNSEWKQIWRMVKQKKRKPFDPKLERRTIGL